MKVALPYPHKFLWPNGRTRSVQAKAREIAKHKCWARTASMAEGRQAFAADAFPLPVKITVGGKKTGPLPDADNVVAAAKSYIDGIALWLGVNDRDFAAPTVDFGPRTDSFEIEVGQ